MTVKPNKSELVYIRFFLIWGIWVLKFKIHGQMCRKYAHFSRRKTTHKIHLLPCNLKATSSGVMTFRVSFGTTCNACLCPRISMYLKLQHPVSPPSYGVDAPSLAKWEWLKPMKAWSQLSPKARSKTWGWYHPFSNLHPRRPPNAILQYTLPIKKLMVPIE